MQILEKLCKQAQRYADANRLVYAVFNLNRIGAPMYVIRTADSFMGEGRMAAGPFIPQPETAELA